MISQIWILDLCPIKKLLSIQQEVSEGTSANTLIHYIFHLDVRAMKCIRGCEAIFILTVAFIFELFKLLNRRRLIWRQDKKSKSNAMSNN